jgi:hypothetical protein
MTRCRRKPRKPITSEDVVRPEPISIVVRPKPITEVFVEKIEQLEAQR